jgi:hypothetical protein
MKGLGIMTAAVVGAVAMGWNAASAQIPSVVQLPSFQTFSYSGSVVVPDRGTTSLGGVRSSAMSSQRRLGARAFGRNQANAGLSVSATIIDLDEMDRQILGAGPQALNPDGSLRKRRGIDPVEEGKTLVRFARKQYREGRRSESFATYQMAISVLDGRLRELAQAEFRRVFGEAADQSLRMASRRR